MDVGSGGEGLKSLKTFLLLTFLVTFFGYKTQLLYRNYG